MSKLLQYSMNRIDEPSVYRTKVYTPEQEAGFTTIGSEAPNENPISITEIGGGGEEPAEEQPDLYEEDRTTDISDPSIELGE